MLVKILKSIWALSALFALFVLLYVYAALPEHVAYYGELEADISFIDREVMFYIMMAVIAITNSVIYALARKSALTMKKSRSVVARKITGWKYGLGITLNFFFLISMQFINIFNSGEKYDYDNFGYLVYFSLGLVFVWILSLPFVLFFSRMKV